MACKIMKKFLNLGLNKNTWIWFHMLGGALWGLYSKIVHVPMLYSVLILLGIVILWEMYEYLKDDVEKIYGSCERFLYDSAGDIIGALIMTILVIC